MRKRSIQIEARLRLGLLLLIPVFVGLAMWVVARQAGGRGDLVKHTLVVQLSLERLLSDLKEAETGQRGYLLTGEPRYLDPYHAATAEVRREIANLNALTADNRIQQGLITRMKPLVEGRLARLELNLDLYRAGRLDPAAERASIDRGKDLMDSIRSVGDEMRGEEELELRACELSFSNASKLFSWSLVGGYGLIVLLVGSLYTRILRHSRQTAEAQQRLSVLNAELDQRVRERTASLQAREELLNIFVKHVPAAVAMLDRDMRYVQVSDRWCSDYSLDNSQVLGRMHYEIFPDLPERWKEIHRRGLSGETLRAEEDRWNRTDGSTVWLHWEIRPWGSSDGLPKGILIFTEDITRHKQIEEQLRESEATTRALLETAAQAILAVDRDGTIVMANRMTGEMFGYAPGALPGKTHEVLVPPRFRERHLAHRANFLSAPGSRPMGLGLDLSGVRRDGSEFPIEVSLSQVETRDGPLSVAFVTDITVRKQAETALRRSEQELRALARRLLTAQEDERRRIARDLHDEVTQQLALLSIEIGKTAAEVDGADAARQRLQGLQRRAIQISDDVRRLSHGLHPSAIEDLGLSSALEELCQEFSAHYDMHVDFDGPAEEITLDVETASSLYRVVQEALHNAAKHARATAGRVTLRRKGGEVRLSVSDDGAGFAGGGEPSERGIGIVNMKERMRMVNGRLSITSRLERGTQVVASVPLSGARS